jgi:hypothetical protein
MAGRLQRLLGCLCPRGLRPSFTPPKGLRVSRQIRWPVDWRRRSPRAEGGWGGHPSFATGAWIAWPLTLRLRPRRCGCRLSMTISYLLLHYGLVEPEPKIFLVHGDDGTEASVFAEALRRQLASVASASTWRSAWVSEFFASAGKWGAVLAFQEKNFDLEPIPRRLASGGHVNIAGKMRPMLQSPEVLFTPPRGEVERIATSAKHDIVQLLASTAIEVTGPIK